MTKPFIIMSVIALALAVWLGVLYEDIETLQTKLRSRQCSKMELEFLYQLEHNRVRDLVELIDYIDSAVINPPDPPPSYWQSLRWDFLDNDSAAAKMNKPFPVEKSKK